MDHRPSISQWSSRQEASMVHRMMRRNRARNPLRASTVIGFLVGGCMAIGGFTLPLLTGESEAKADLTLNVAALAVDQVTPIPAAELSAAYRELVRERFFETEVPYGRLIYAEAKDHGIPAELIAAVIEVESRFDPQALSHRNAQGLMQLLPSTGQWMGARNLWSPEQNIHAGARYLAYLNGRFDGNVDIVLAAYNAGEGVVRKHAGIPPYRETQSYVRKVRKARESYERRVALKIVDFAYAGPAMPEAELVAAATR